MLNAWHVLRRLKNWFRRLGFSLQIFKTALAASISWAVATGFFNTHYPFFAPLAAILTVQVTVSDSLQKASQRIIGIVLGVIISMLVGLWLNINSVTIFLMIFIGMTVFNGLKMNAQIISQIAVSSFLVLAFGESNEYALERIVETVIGSSIAVAINALIVPQNAVSEIKKQILTLTEKSSLSLKKLAELFHHSSVNIDTGKREVKELVEQTDKTLQNLKIAQQSLKYTPFLSASRAILQQYSKDLTKLEYMTVQIRGIRRGLSDLHLVSDFKIEYSKIKDLDKAIYLTAACIQSFGKMIVAPDEEGKTALIKQIEEAKTAQVICVNNLITIKNTIVLRDIGAILTDLNRILDEINFE